MSPSRPRTVEVLDEASCRRLLSSAVLGRLAFTEAALPTIQPVSFTLHEGRVVIPTGTGSKMAAASRGAIVAFEVDDYDPTTRTGWNVTVIGPSRGVQEPAELQAMAALGAEAWAPAEDPCYIVIQPTLLRGRRLTAT